MSAAPGAAALLDPANESTTWDKIDSVDSITPEPLEAKSDRPSFYDDGSGCQIKAGNPVPKICASGDKSAEKSLMLVGDSKIGQWQTAFSEIGRREGWRVLTATKSGCAFTDASTKGGGESRDDCRGWGRSTMKQILKKKPDVVVTSQVHDLALPEGKTSAKDRTKNAMIQGLHSYWNQLQDAGIQVVVMLDNPMPTTHPVYQCVEDNPQSLSKCAYSLDEAWPGSSAPVQRKAVESTAGVRVIDMMSTICPGRVMCPAVIGNVLVYRAGSHITDTFTVSAQTQLAEALAAATDGKFGTAPPTG
ncbi:MAG: hypothetical protein H7201_04580 [Candidatus Saccharibacteria bacterium]|nr:hypothetical protein [Microbacteriaceae bacterium]